MSYVPVPIDGGASVTITNLSVSGLNVSFTVTNTFNSAKDVIPVLRDTNGNIV